jgi:hypothetical protein
MIMLAAVPLSITAVALSLLLISVLAAVAL